MQGGGHVAKEKSPSLGEKKARAKPNRDPRTGQFLPGNKSGGRRELPEDLKEAFRAASPDALRLLVQIVNNDEAKDTDRIRAAEIILDRGYGKPRQAVDLDASNIPQVVIVGDVPD